MGTADRTHRVTVRPNSTPQTWRCKAGDDVLTQIGPFVPTAHYIKDDNGVTGRWCEAGYEPTVTGEQEPGR